MHFVEDRMFQFLSSRAFHYEDSILVVSFFLPEVLDLAEKIKED